MKQPAVGMIGIRIAAAAITMLAAGGTSGGAPAVLASPARPVGPGHAVVLRVAATGVEAAAEEASDLVIHFHGAVDTVRQAMERAGTTATVVVVNQPGLSAAYAAPFRDDPGLFERLLAEPVRDDDGSGGSRPPRWRRVTLSCFSAGYGAVREILREEKAFGRIDAIVAADSIYAGIDGPASGNGSRRVDARDMDRFLAFAVEAAARRKVFVISHSAQPTPYASTTETADYLLGHLGLERTPLEPRGGEEYPQVSEARHGGFEVRGFAGASGPAHLFHLRSLDRWWRSAADRAAAP